MELWIIVIYLTTQRSFLRTSDPETQLSANDEIKTVSGNIDLMNQPLIIEECDEDTSESEDCQEDIEEAYEYLPQKPKKCFCTRKRTKSTSTMKTTSSPTTPTILVCPPCPPCPTCSPCIQIPPPACPACPKYSCKSEEEEIVIDFG